MRLFRVTEINTSLKAAGLSLYGPCQVQGTAGIWIMIRLGLGFRGAGVEGPPPLFYTGGILFWGLKKGP